MKLSRLLVEIRHIGFREPIEINGITLDRMDMNFEHYNNDLVSGSWAAKLPSDNYIVFDGYEAEIARHIPDGIDRVLRWDQKPNWWDYALAVLGDEIVKQPNL